VSRRFWRDARVLALRSCCAKIHAVAPDSRVISKVADACPLTSAPEPLDPSRAARSLPVRASYYLPGEVTARPGEESRSAETGSRLCAQITNETPPPCVGQGRRVEYEVYRDIARRVGSDAVAQHCADTPSIRVTGVWGVAMFHGVDRGWPLPVTATANSMQAVNDNDPVRAALFGCARRQSLPRELVRDLWGTARMLIMQAQHESLRAWTDSEVAFWQVLRKAAYSTDLVRLRNNGSINLTLVPSWQGRPSSGRSRQTKSRCQLDSV